MTLDDKIYEEITTLCKQGEDFLEENEDNEALKCFNKALNLVPSPKTDWEASLWIYSALGDIYYLESEEKKALEHFHSAYNCPDGTENPFVLLRLGQCYFDLDDFDKAKEFLFRAYMMEGEEIFEEEDEEYFEYIEGVIENLDLDSKPNKIIDLSMIQKFENCPVKEVDSLMHQGFEELNNDQFLQGNKTLQKAWSKLPEPKYKWSQSNLIVEYICRSLLSLKNFDDLKNWIEIYKQCDNSGLSSGESEMLAGIVAYESGDKKEAMKYFKIANKKSDGRCFESEDKKYLDFFLSNSK